LTAADPGSATWQTLPDGDVGLRTPPGGGPIAEEQNVSVLSDGSFFCVYRTVDGHPVCTYSRDAGHTWSPPQYMRYADGRPIKHPRAANFAWKCHNGKYLYWYHNHGGRSFADRNPAWLCGGIEVDSPQGKMIQWSQPEIVLYDDDPTVRMSYPDLIEDEGDFFLTETQKTIARVHPIARSLPEGLWNQFENSIATTEGLILDFPNAGASTAKLPGSRWKTGLAFDLWIECETLAPDQILIDSREERDRGVLLQTAPDSTVEIVLNDGQTEDRWACDKGMLQPGRLHHVVVNVDGGSRIVTFIVDGKLCDGGIARQFGWGRFRTELDEACGGQTLRLTPGSVRIHRLRVYDRYLRTSEAIANYRAGVYAP
jgi:hypothetical protein